MADEGETERNRPGMDGGEQLNPGAGAQGEAASQAERLPGEGTPEGEKLRQAHGAFEVGDYRRVRQLCDELQGGPEQVARAAAELRKRTEVDPVQLGVLAGCLAIFLIIVYVYVL
jgi:hypothetical protein